MKDSAQKARLRRKCRKCGKKMGVVVVCEDAVPSGWACGYCGWSQDEAWDKYQRAKEI